MPTLFIRTRNYDLVPWVTFKSGQGPQGPSSVACQTTLTAGYSFARQRACKVKSVRTGQRLGGRRGYATGRLWISKQGQDALRSEVALQEESVLMGGLMLVTMVRLFCSSALLGEMV